jgi:hypothetical protein
MLSGTLRYLVLGLNNAEMRAGAGMVLSLGELRLSDGRLSLTQLQSVGEVAVPAGVDIGDADMARMWGWAGPSRDWRNLLLSPRFAASAQLAARMWVAAGREPVDGVLAVDPRALAAVLDATGPVDAGGRRYEAGTVTQELWHEQYVRNAGPSQTVRRDELADVARAAFDAIDTRDWSVRRLARRIADAARGRHLMVWSADEHVASAWAAAGADGALSQPGILLSVVNAGADKLDPFLDVRATVRRSGRTAVVRVTMRNDTPDGQPTYVLGVTPPPDGGNGRYVGLVALSVAGPGMGVELTGAPLAVGGRDGDGAVAGTRFVLERGASKVVEFVLTVPTSARAVRVEASSRSRATSWRAGDSTWRDVIPHDVGWSRRFE